MARTVLTTAAIVGLASVDAIQAALAGPVGVPGPIVGAGLPLLVVAAGAYVAVKLIRARRD